MEDNRINRRSRPRPYDLRRKVLLKNFLRVQMTYIPIHMPSVSQNDSANFPPESSVSVPFEDPSTLNVDASSATTAGDSPINPGLSENNNSDQMSTDAANDVINVDSSVASTNSVVQSDNESSNMFKFTSLVKFKRESKKTLKGIFKAKEVHKNVTSPIKTRSFKSGFQRVFYGRKRANESSSSNQKSRNSPRSLFSLFKHRKDQRQAREIDRIKRSPVNFHASSMSAKYNSINQAIQTDNSWVRNELHKVRQSNRRLKEENRLLSESLSYFMSSASMDPHVRYSDSPHQTYNKNRNSMVFPDYYPPPSNSNNIWNSNNLRSRVSRSKSVHEYSERMNLPRNNYRTRSMSFHNNQANIVASSKPSFSTHGRQVETNIPRIRRKRILPNIPTSNSLRGIQRRSSMPERPLSENNRSRICRRSGSLRDTYRQPFFTLPSEAFY